MSPFPSQFIVDAFTDQLFAGNPAAVCLQPLPEALMQRVAQENNLSETAFLTKTGDDYALRWLEVYKRQDTMEGKHSSACFWLLERGAAGVPPAGPAPVPKGIMMRRATGPSPQRQVRGAREAPRRSQGS